jgi:epoxide hydrolase-like predicted phosphatase
MNTKIKFIYFDLGAVIATWNSFQGEIAKITKTRIIDVRNFFDQYDSKAVIGKISSDEMLNLYFKKANLENEGQYSFAELILKSFKKVDETFNLLSVARNYYEIGLLTNIYTGIIEQALKENFFNVKFKVIVKSCEVKVAKPDTRIFQIAVEKSGHQAKEILFIDDLEENIDSAKKFGLNTFLFDKNNPEISTTEIKRYLAISNQG